MHPPSTDQAPPPRHARRWWKLVTLSSGARLLIPLVISVAIAAMIPLPSSAPVRAVAAWDGFALTALLLMWLPILLLEPEHIRQIANSEDPGRPIARALVVAGAGASLLAVGVLLKLSKTMGGMDKLGATGLALSAVVLAWLLTHTVFTLRYAHLYYGTGKEATSGLQFPDNLPEPDYLDFAYFAFVIGMTAQTADIAITSRQMRRTALQHGILSFGFNTAVVALSIGALSSVL